MIASKRSISQAVPMMQQTPEVQQPALAWHFEQPMEQSEGNSFPRRDEGRQGDGSEKSWQHDFLYKKYLYSNII